MYDTQERAAVIIDGPCAEPFEEWLDTHPCQSVTIWNTHHHGDHVGINTPLTDGRLAYSVDVYGCADRQKDIPGLSHPLSDGDRLTFAGQIFTVWRTDGHVDGHLCFVHDEILFCGDTLFAGGCGYLFDGPATAMYDSLMRLSTLAGTVRVCCAHEYTVDNLKFAAFIEPENKQVKSRYENAVRRVSRGETTLPSTITQERLTNPFLRTSDEHLRQAVSVIAGQEVERDLELFTLIRTLKDQKIHRH
jgi:hydroxyacylglutathione hydrolase